jgi:hypothetical protein
MRWINESNRFKRYPISRSTRCLEAANSAPTRSPECAGEGRRELLIAKKELRFTFAKGSFYKLWVFLDH